MSQSQILSLKIAAVLWVIWGLVHAFAGIIVLTSETAAGFSAVADAVPDEAFADSYHGAVGGILNQHGWNLLWFGVVTIIGGVLIWRQNMTAIWVSAMVGGLADLGYFLFLDIPGFVNFVPGTVMTLVSSSAILLSGWVWVTARRAAPA
ncbi:MAG: hypothetical protein AAF376_13615 [Pseudomonadota bacterium]